MALLSRPQNEYSWKSLTPSEIQAQSNLKLEAEPQTDLSLNQSICSWFTFRPIVLRINLFSFATEFEGIF